MAAVGLGLALALAAQATGAGTGGGAPFVAALSAGDFEAALEPGGCSGPFAVFYGTFFVDSDLGQDAAGHEGHGTGGEDELGHSSAPGSHAFDEAANAAEAIEASAFSEFGEAAWDLQDFACFGAVSCRAWPGLCLEQNVRRTPAVVSYPPSYGSSRFHFGSIEKQSLVRMLLNQAEPRDLTQQITLENVQQFLASPLKPLKVLLFSEEPVSRGFANMALLSSDQALRPHAEFGFVTKEAAPQLLKRFGIAEVPTIILQRGLDASSRKVLSGAGWIFEEHRRWISDYVEASAMRGGLDAVIEAAPQAWRPAPRRPAADERVPELHRESFERVRASKADLLVYLRESELEDQEAEMLASLQHRFEQQLSSSRVKLAWAWLDLEQEPHWLDTFGVSTLPTVVYVKPNKNQRFVGLVHERSASGGALPADAESISSFLDEVLAGSMKFRPLRPAQLSQWSDRFATVEPRRSGAAAAEAPKGAASRRKPKGAKYWRLEYGAAGCPWGHEIRSLKECEKAIKSLGIKTEPKWASNYGGVPRWCSIREGSSKSSPERLHFNSAREGQGREDLAPICRARNSAAETAQAVESDLAMTDSDIAAAEPENDQLASRVEKLQGEVHEARAKIDDVKALVSEALARASGLEELQQALENAKDTGAHQAALDSTDYKEREVRAPKPQEPTGLHQLSRHTRRPLFGEPGSWLLYFSNGRLASEEEEMLTKLQRHLSSHKEAGSLRFAWLNAHDEPELFGLFEGPRGKAHRRGIEALPSAVLLQSDGERLRFLSAKHERRGGVALPVDEWRLKVLLAEALVEEPDFTPWMDWPEGQRR